MALDSRRNNKKRIVEQEQPIQLEKFQTQVGARIWCSRPSRDILLCSDIARWVLLGMVRFLCVETRTQALQAKMKIRASNAGNGRMSYPKRKIPDKVNCSNERKSSSDRHRAAIPAQKALRIYAQGYHADQRQGKAPRKREGKELIHSLQCSAHIDPYSATYRPANKPAFAPSSQPYHPNLRRAWCLLPLSKITLGDGMQNRRADLSLDAACPAGVSRGTGCMAPTRGMAPPSMQAMAARHRLHPLEQ